MNKINQWFFPHDDKPQHFKSLDGLRGIAVLLVLLSHSSNAKVFIREELNFFAIGKIGVYLFFVLSAYLLDRQIALAFMENKSSLAYWNNYFLRRFLRIYPLFIIALIIHGLFTIAGMETVINKWTELFWHLTFLKGESIFWSIPVEFKYYFISPLIMWFCHKILKWNPAMLMLVFTIMIVATIAIEFIFHLPLLSTFRYFPIFLVGTIISIYELLFKQQLDKRVKPILFSLAGLGAFVLILITTPHYFDKLFGFKLWVHDPIYFLPYAILWGVVLLSTKYGNGLIKKLLELKVLRFIGTISFSLYLFHMLTLTFTLQAGIMPQLQFFVFFFISILVSTISYLLIERPLSKIKILS